MKGIASLFLVLCLSVASANAAVIEDFEDWDGDGTAVVDPQNPTNTVLALAAGQYVEVDLPDSEGLVTIDIYDFGEVSSSTSAFGPRWCIEGDSSSAGFSIIYTSSLDGSAGYGYSFEPSRIGSWYSPSFYGGPRQCTLETSATANNGVGRWTTWTFDVQSDGSVEMSAPFGSVKTQYYNGDPISVPNMSKVWLSGGRSGVTVGPVASGTYAGYTVLVDNIDMPESTGETSRPGDANCDGIVNLDDFIILKQNYGTGEFWGQGDFNGDGTVNLDDFIILKQHYGSSDFAQQPSFEDNFDPGWIAGAHHWRVATWMQNGTQMGTSRCAADGEGHLVQTVLAGGPPYYGGSMQSSIEFPYGRWVARLKPSPISGVLNSMFTKDWDNMSVPGDGDGTGYEVDIELLTYTFGNNTGQVHIAYHEEVDNTFVDNVTLDFNPSDDYHDWGFDILPDKIVWHVDGKVLREYKPTGSVRIVEDYEMFFNSWTSVNWIHGPAASDAHYFIDSVRFYPYTPYVEE